MPRVTRTVPENNDLMERLGAGIANVSGCNALFAAVQRRNVLPDTATFIIGVGGSGCQTVDAIKHKFVSEFQNWLYPCCRQRILKRRHQMTPPLAILVFRFYPNY